MPTGQRITDGTQDFSGGVDSGRVTTIESSSNPHGLKRNMLAWLENGTVRGGGITPRAGFQPLVQGQKWSGLFQGASIYEPLNGNPYIMLDIGGRTYQVRVDTDNSVHDVTAGNALPANLDQHWFVQGEEFRITQDSQSEPLVWDGTVLRKISAMGGAAPYLPTGTAMAYYNGRVAVASGGRVYMFGDIVNGTALGTSNILHALENQSIAGGGALTLPTNAGNIRGFGVTSNINQPVSVGTLFVGTRKAIYAFNGGTKRSDWANLILQTVAQYGNGFVSDRSIVGWNGDLFFQTLEPGVRSLGLAVRYADQWANTPLSSNENRVLGLADRALLRFASGIEFNNRLLMSTSPFSTPVGVGHNIIMPLDFDLISNLESKLANSGVVPAWEGGIEGLTFLQLLQGDFGGLQRAFAVVYSRVSLQIEIWELTLAQLTDNGDNRVSWYFETPSFDFNNPFALKELETMEIWYDQLFGTVEFEAWFRPDQHACWYFWHAWKECSARSCAEDPTNLMPCGYPTQNYCATERPGRVMPKPISFCNTVTGRQISWGYQFQIKIVVKGSCRIRGIMLHALPREKAPFDGMICNPPSPVGSTAPVFILFADEAGNVVIDDAGTALALN